MSAGYLALSFICDKRKEPRSRAQLSEKFTCKSYFYCHLWMRWQVSLGARPLQDLSSSSFYPLKAPPKEGTAGLTVVQHFPLAHKAIKNYFVETYRSSIKRLDICSRLTLMQMPVLQDEHSVVLLTAISWHLLLKLHVFINSKQRKRKAGPALIESVGSSTLCMWTRF